MWILVVTLVCVVGGDKLHETVNDDVDEQQFKQALLDAYDVNNSFTENFYSLLGIICPSSVLCTGNINDTSAINYTWITGLVD